MSFHIRAAGVGSHLFVIGLLVSLALGNASVVVAQSADLAAGLDIAPGTKIFAETYRLLMNVYVQPGKGLCVALLRPGTPTTKMTLAGRPNVKGVMEVGDRITHINGKEIVDLKTLYDELEASGGAAVRLAVVDKNTGRTIDWLVSPVKVSAPVVPDKDPTAVDTPPRKRIARVLLIGLTDDASIGEQIGVSLSYLERLLREQITEDQLDLEVVKGKDCNAKTIISKVRGLGRKAKGDDAILCYFLGHGAYDSRYARNDPSGGHFFQIPTGDLLRKTLFENILAQPGRLKALVTDTCNAESTAAPVNVQFSYEQRVVTVEQATNLEQLLLYHRGYVDLSASSRNQLSWFDKINGGWFSSQFNALAREHNDWNSLLSSLSTESNRFFLENRERILRDPTIVDANVLREIRLQTAMEPAVFRMSLAKDSRVERRPPEHRTVTIRVAVP